MDFSDETKRKRKECAGVKMLFIVAHILTEARVTTEHERGGFSMFGAT